LLEAVNIYITPYSCSAVGRNKFDTELYMILQLVVTVQQFYIDVSVMDNKI